MKKYLIILTVAGLILGGSLAASAQTISTSSLQAIIRMLQNRINALTAQIQALQQAQTQLQTATSTASVSNALRLIAQLHVGDSGDSVKLLQTALAADPNIYPEGIISGYFGQLTAKAVRQFQKLHGLAQVGNVGPGTLKELNKELDRNPVGQETDDNGEHVHCAIIPPGHLIAPGWLRKHDNEHPIVPPCQTLPPGIEGGLEGEGEHATSTPNAPPVISQIVVTGITASGAHVTWTTDKLATSKVWYSTSTPVVTSGTPSFSDGTLVASHNVLISNLNASTTYYFAISSADSLGDVASWGQGTFTTLGQ